MKELKYTTDQVFAVAKLLEQVFNLYPATTQEEKSIRSIAYDLEEKFSNKCKQLVKKNNLFQVGKTHKLTLKYHEEHALYKIIFDLIGTVNSQKSKYDLQSLFNQLHKKLL